jgi:hypothetical protein
LLEETKKEQSLESCSYQCNDAHHQAVCVLANDLCRCGHSRSLHLMSTSSSPPRPISQIVEEKLSQEIGSGVLISRVGSSDGASSSKENVVYTSLTKSDNDSQHCWIDVRGSEMRPQGQETSSRPLSKSVSKKKFQMEEVLHPLERGYEVPRGRMVVILQALRYFDVFFWSSPSRLRNEHLLNFTAHLSSNGPEGQKKTKKTQFPSLSLYNILLRMSLYVAHRLSPFTQLAVLNVKRIHILMKNIDKILPDSCPRNEWVMVVIAHMIAALHRIHQSFSPRVYEILNLSYQTESLLDGPLDATQKQAEMKQFHELEENDQGFSRFLEEHDAVQSLNNIFLSPSGRQLIDYLCACIDVLVTLYQTQRELIATVMGDRGFMAYTLIIEKHEKLLAKLPTLKPVVRSRSTSRDLRERRNSASLRVDSITEEQQQQQQPLSSSVPSPEHRRHSLSIDDERSR